MITFELDQTQEGIELFLDSAGVDELINYLTYIKLNEEDMHLTIGNELSTDIMHDGNSLIKHVKMLFLEKDQ